MSTSNTEKKARAPRVVVAAPDGDSSEALADALARGGYDPHRTPSPESTTLAVSYRSPDAVFLDGTFLERSGFRLLDSIHLSAPGMPVLVMAPAGNDTLRIKSLALGAEDCLAQPFSEQEALIRLRRILQRKKTADTLQTQTDQAEGRTETLQRELSRLRGQLRRNVGLLQTAVEFHQRLDPRGEPGAMQRGFLRNLSAQLGIDRLAFLAPPHPGASWLTVRAAWGLPERLAERLRFQDSGELASVLASTAKPLLVERGSAVPGLRLELGMLAATGFTAVMPLLHQGRLQGVVLLGECQGGGAPDDEVLRMGQFLGTALTPALAAQEVWSREHHVTASTLGFLVDHLEARDPYLRGHSLAVAHRVETLGRRLGMAGAELSSLTAAALLHDVGYFEVDVAFWTQEKPLSASDWALIRRHPDQGAHLLADAAWGDAIQAAVRHHHERWDGDGYPGRLAGETIPWHARILAVADGLEAMVQPRAYRPALSLDEAMDSIRADAGSHYDPEIVRVLTRD